MQEIFESADFMQPAEDERFRVARISVLSRVPASQCRRINPYPANVDKMVVLLPVLANGGWNLIRRLKG
jgi:hypothetical protein